MTRVAHISDLHFGKARQGDVDALLQDLREIKAEFIVITGDLTQAGRKREFLAAREFLRELPSPYLVVPGNHDLPVRNLMLRLLRPLERFHSYIAENEQAIAIIKDLAMVGLNSARRASLHWDWSLGSVSHRQRTHVADVLRAHARHAFRMVALHHPMIHSEARAGKQLVGGATRALDAWARAGADVIVHGHGHLPRVQLVNSATRALIIMQSGSSLGVRLRGEPGGYNVLDFLGPSQVGVSMRTKESSAYAQGEAKLFVRNAVGWHTLKRHSSGPSGSIAIAREATHLFASTSKADLIARASSHNHHTR